MVPPPSDPCWKRLIERRSEYSFQQLPLRLLMKQIDLRLSRDTSAAAVDTALRDVHAFFSKYERIVERELHQITR
jgi:hypothetical protein